MPVHQPRLGAATLQTHSCLYGVYGSTQSRHHRISCFPGPRDNSVLKIYSLPVLVPPGHAASFCMPDHSVFPHSVCRSACLSFCMLSSCLPVWFWGKYHHHSPGVRQSFECIHPGHSLPLSQLWPPARIIRVTVPQVSHFWPFPTCPDASESQWPGPLTLRFTSLVLRSHCSSSQRAYQTAPYLPVLATNSRPL